MFISNIHIFLCMHINIYICNTCISIFEVLSTISPTFDHLYKELRVNWSLPWSSLLNKQTSKQMSSSSDPSLSSSELKDFRPPSVAMAQLSVPWCMARLLIGGQ